MGKLMHGRIKRLHAEFRGDEAVEIELLEVTLRMGDVARTPIEADTLLVGLAFQALRRAIDEYCNKTGMRYPPYRALLSYLSGRSEGGGEPEASRIVNLSK
ncbi:MAG: hypothetical protein A3G24_13845 [Betaproteobacteria bacterium RIFCSPLOWO2_12_FULL_62_13]|nr:MAG: hypothetical protein A3G24_13845 [Betaproteobacteria bacterium RIFCSPLOWO2_12_FULL_62_13]